MKQVTLLPVYMKQFSCIGGDCEDTCCSGWRIDIDKATYKKYKNVREPGMKTKLSQGLKRNRAQADTSGSYAYINLDSNCMCPLLNEKGLCGIQEKLGEHMLSSVCATYPRVLNSVDSIAELSAKLSCPEAARLALLNPGGIDFEELEQDIKSEWIVAKSIGKQEPTFKKELLWKLRVLAIDIIQNRKMAISDRLIMLGLFTDKLQKYLGEEQYDQISELIKEYYVKMNHEGYIDSFNQIKINLKLQTRIITELVQIRATMGYSTDKTTVFHNNMVAGLTLGKNEDDDIRELIERNFSLNYKNHYQPFLEKYEFILENYLVNYIYSSLYPNITKNDVFDEYVQICVLYSIIKIFMIGIAGYNKGLTSDDAVNVIQKISRQVEHNSKYLNHVRQLLKEHHFDTLGHLATMVKDSEVELLNLV